MKANDTDTAVIHATEYSYRAPIGDAWVVDGSATAITSRAKRKGLLAGIATVILLAGTALAASMAGGILPYEGATEHLWVVWAVGVYLAIMLAAGAAVLGGKVAHHAVIEHAVAKIGPTAALGLTTSQRDAIVNTTAEDPERGQMLADEIGTMYAEQAAKVRAAEANRVEAERRAERTRLETMRAEARKAAHKLR
ncbi:hypothetical protein LG293_16010 (plasmid) [Citricoccus nitrophenolicus]